MMAIEALVRRILINISNLAQGNESSQVYFKFLRYSKFANSEVQHREIEIN